MKDAGITAPVPRGDWQANVNYYFLNIVNHNGISWIAKRENMGQEPSDGLYWQRFGTSVPIATTSVAGIVKPDGATISVDASGTITVEIDGESIFIDDEDNKIKASLATLADVDVTDLEDGYVLAWDATAEKFVPVEKGGGGILPHLIIITEPNETSVKAVKGQTEIVAVETSSGHYECDIPEFGTWTIHAILNGDDAQVSLVVDTVKIYTVDDSHFHSDITVTYPTGAQVSCSKTGEQTMYATGSPYTFTVHSAGIWTITGTFNGRAVTKTVNVTTSGQDFNVYFQNTITVDIYSAASDTVLFTDETGSKTATTDTTGKAENISITYSAFKNNVIQFTSSVAKNPSDLSTDYTKLIYLDEDTDNVYVMPEDSLYWYGYESDNLEDVSTANGWDGGGLSFTAPTHNTNHINIAAQSNTYSGIGNKTALSITKTHTLMESTTIGASLGLRTGVFNSKSTGASSTKYEGQTTANNIQKFDVVFNSSYCGVFGWQNNRAGKCYALWHKVRSEYNFFSAANDIVTYKDSNNNDVVFAITDEDGYAKVDFSAVPQGTYTLYSSVAKDPDYLSSNYSKSITVNSETTSIYLMPNDNTLYWYGYMGENCEEMSRVNGWEPAGSQYNFIVPTYNTNYLYANTGTTRWDNSGIGSKVAISSANKLVCIAKGVSKGSGAQYATLNGNSDKTLAAQAAHAVTPLTPVATTSIAKYECDSSAASNFYATWSAALSSADLYALWYE